MHCKPSWCISSSTKEDANYYCAQTNYASFFFLYRVEFHLSESGDIFWRVPKHVSQIPYIVSSFDFYRVTGTRFHFLRFIGGQSGEWFDFNVSIIMSFEFTILFC